MLEVEGAECSRERVVVTTFVKCMRRILPKEVLVKGDPRHHTRRN